MKQSDIQIPIALGTIIAEKGETNDIPVLSTGTAKASQVDGFPDITMRRFEDGGEPPYGQDFNGFLKLLSSHLFLLQNGGVYTYDEAISNIIGGYPKESLLYYNNGTEIRVVQSLIDDNTYNFITNPSYIDDGVHWETVIPTTTWINSNFVTLNTAQTISAVKTFTDDIKRTIDLDVTTAPATNRYFVPFEVRNSDESAKYFEQLSYLTTGALRQTLGLRRTINGTNVFNNIVQEIDANGNGSFNLEIPSTSGNKNLSATSDGSLRWTGKNVAIFSAYNTAERGYAKFTNGIIMQWGNESKGNNLAITFPTPFSSTNYSVTINSTATSTEAYSRNVNNKTTTGFTMHVGGGASNYTWNWIAIGY